MGDGFWKAVAGSEGVQDISFTEESKISVHCLIAFAIFQRFSLSLDNLKSGNEIQNFSTSMGETRAATAANASSFNMQRNAADFYQVMI